ncbi:DNA cytosine methyltransferase [Aestuariivirga sp.]|uniref:DNA cytosine methyltransferase n=1 Tax=Aestuariivirga sp. TaxID=2650926 RepID=UPI0025C3EF07|nr:DNA cytosine methyltransferase [Aestuariivirga sp.]
MPKIIDLFCGCGGFSLGAEASGLVPTAAFDIDPILTSSFLVNHPKSRLILTDLSKATGADIIQVAGGQVDGVFGGPPCQAFSAIGHRHVDDPRRTLLGHFFRLISELKPSFFVMENVTGLGYSNTRRVLNEALSLIPSRYNVLGPLVLDSADFGAATRRPRLFIIGYDPARCDNLTEADIETRKQKPTTVRAAISDLATAVQLHDDGEYDQWKICQRGRPSSYAACLRNKDGTFTGHRRTVHSPEVIKRFKKVEQGGIETVGRHPRLSWHGQCPTLRAGTGNDRGSFQSVRPLHPDEPRVITVREGARLQGFPDGFRFHPAVWHSFRMIGNSVSPILSKMIFSLIASRIETGRGFRLAAE